MNARKSVVILSDIHISTMASSAWYRKEIHEKYLIAIFNDIIEHANQIEEIIILGDIFGFWVCPPNVIPPTIDDIIADNPKILGTQGKLCQVLSALKGRVVFIPGDHDMNVTQSDLNQIKSSDGYTIKYNAGSYIPAYDTHIKFTYGYEFTLLNTPYYWSELDPLPIYINEDFNRSYLPRYANNNTPVSMQPYMATKIEIKQISTPHPPKFTFGWSNYDASLEFFSTIEMGVLSKADELGIDVITNDERSNTVEMITGSIDLINKSINALIITPYNPEGLPFIVANAQKNQIPVVVIDIGTGGADVSAFIVSDSFGGGIFAGEYALLLIKKYAIKSKNIAIIKVQKTAPYALLRGEGFKRVVLAEGYNIVAEKTANSIESEGYEVMKSILLSYADDLAVVFSENGTMALGAARAIEEASKKGIIMLIGFDATPSVMDAIRRGSMQGTIAQMPFKMGEIGVETANSVLLGIPIIYDDPTKKLILMEVFLVDEYGEVKREIT